MYSRRSCLNPTTLLYRGLCQYTVISWDIVYRHWIGFNYIKYWRRTELPDCLATIHYTAESYIEHQLNTVLHFHTTSLGELCLCALVMCMTELPDCLATIHYTADSYIEHQLNTVLHFHTTSLGELHLCALVMCMTELPDCLATIHYTADSYIEHQLNTVLHFHTTSLGELCSQQFYTSAQ